MTRVAIIGAGLAGLVVARRLKHVANVTVFEKSRGPGGRIATRYASQFEFDHGAQFFTARSQAFQSFVEPMRGDGRIANWSATFAELDRGEIVTLRDWDDRVPHFVGQPRMNQIGKDLANGLDVRYQTTVEKLDRDDGEWQLTDSAGLSLGRFDWLLITAPSSQTARLVDSGSELSLLAEQRKMLGCFALMLGFDKPLQLPWQAALVRNADVSWISVNSSKPGRAEPFTLVVHSTNAWAEAHIDHDLDSVQDHLLQEASQVTSCDLAAATHSRVHRWRFANIARQDGPQCFLDPARKIAACGDWFVRGRIEAAFLSADELSSRLDYLLTSPAPW